MIAVVLAVILFSTELIRKAKIKRILGKYVINFGNLLILPKIHLQILIPLHENKILRTARNRNRSCHLLTLDSGYTILLDCGLYQGREGELDDF